MKFPLVALVLILSSNLWAGVGESIRTLGAVEREGKGNEEASVAWKEVVKAGPSALPGLVEGAGKGTAVADNWIRLAGDAIVEGALRDNKPLPLAELKAFLLDTSRAAAGRQLTFDLLRKADPEAASALEPKLISDPVQELRRGAVQRMIDGAKGASPAMAKSIYTEALTSVRDEDQTKFLATELKKLGTPVDLPKHFGFLTKWQVIGPFDNSERKGFEIAFPPENELKPDASYIGKSGPVKWEPFESKEESGKLDFNKPLGMQKEATAYALGNFDSPTERDAEIRLGCKNAWKVWLNGQLLFGRDEYHRGQQMDQYKLKCHLKAGPNSILVKCCQNEQKEEWTVEWEFQLRVCDSTGTALASANVQ